MQKYKVYVNNEYKEVIDNWDDFCSNYTFVEAAGGVVYNTKNQLLMIFRNQKWDLPKGKLECNEKISECAIREVEEECGVRNLQIISQLQNTYHIYNLNGQSILKCTYWFKMSTDFTDKLVPQISEGITNVEWINQINVVDKLENSYGNIKDILQYA